MKEIWKNIPNFKDYQASNLGRIRSLDRLITQINRWGKLASRKYPGKIFTFNTFSRANTDYECVLMNGSKITVHVLILLAFKGPMPKKYKVIRHLDGNSFNNKLSNLKYGTFSENEIDKYRYGTPKGKLTTEEVIEIRKLFGTGISHKNIGWLFGVNRRTISSIYENVSYAWLNKSGEIDG